MVQCFENGIVTLLSNSDLLPALGSICLPFKACLFLYCHRHICYVYILDDERSDIESTVSVDNDDTRNSKGHMSKGATSRPAVPSIQLNGPITKASQDSNHPPTFGTDPPEQLPPIEPNTPSGKVDSPTTVRSQTPDLTISSLNCSDLVHDEESNHNDSKFKRTVRSAPVSHYRVHIQQYIILYIISLIFSK